MEGLDLFGALVGREAGANTWMLNRPGSVADDAVARPEGRHGRARFEDVADELRADGVERQGSAVLECFAQNERLVAVVARKGADLDEDVVVVLRRSGVEGRIPSMHQPAGYRHAFQHDAIQHLDMREDAEGAAAANGNVAHGLACCVSERDRAQPH